MPDPRIATPPPAAARRAVGDVLARLRAAGVVVLKDEPAVRVERLGSGSDEVVQKTYRNRGLRLLQTFLRRSRARREHDNLARIERAGVPCTRPITFGEQRRLGFVTTSTLVTRYVPGTTPRKAELARLPRDDRARRRLVQGVGVLLRRLHAAGLLWCTAVPRNVLLVAAAPPTAAAAAAPDLVLCDAPAAVAFGRPVPPGPAAIDLYDALMSPSRQLELTRAERWLGLCAYAGDAAAARGLWRRLARRRPWWHRLHKNFVMAVRTYILGRVRATS